MDDLKSDYRAGFVGIVGRPNVGKSTMLNRFIGSKVAIVTHKPQTTRTRFLGVGNYEDFQVAFLDTPGMHSPKDKLGNYMITQINRVINESDVLIFVIDAAVGIIEEDLLLIKRIEKSKKSTLLVINKIDLVLKENLLSLIDEVKDYYSFKEYIPISAKSGENFQVLINALRKYLPVSEKLFPDDIITDTPEHIIISEIVREELLRQTHQEIPYSCAVIVKEISYRKKKDITYINITIYLERESQKSIVIGEKGKKIKNIGKFSRIKLEDFLGTKVFLDLNVDVLPNWKKKENFLKNLGYKIS